MCEYHLKRIAIRSSGLVALILECPEHGTVIGVQGSIPSDASASADSPVDVARIVDSFDYIVGRELASQGMDGLSRTPEDAHFDPSYAGMANDPKLRAGLAALGFPVDMVPNPRAIVPQRPNLDDLPLAIRAILEGLPMELPDEPEWEV